MPSLLLGTRSQVLCTTQLARQQYQYGVKYVSTLNWWLILYLCIVLYRASGKYRLLNITFIGEDKVKVPVFVTYAELFFASSV